MQIRIINPTVTKSWEEDSRLAYARAAGPGVEVSIVTLDWGTASIESARDHALVVPDILNKIVSVSKKRRSDSIDIRIWANRLSRVSIVLLDIFRMANDGKFGQNTLDIISIR